MNNTQQATSLLSVLSGVLKTVTLTQQFSRMGYIYCFSIVMLVGCSNTPQNPIIARTAFLKGKPNSYLVQEGDTLSGIAYKNHRNYRDLARINQIPSPYVIVTGQYLDLGSPNVNSNSSNIKPNSSKNITPSLAPQSIVSSQQTLTSSNPKNMIVDGVSATALSNSANDTLFPQSSSSRVFVPQEASTAKSESKSQSESITVTKSKPIAEPVSSNSVISNTTSNPSTSATINASNTTVVKSSTKTVKAWIWPTAGTVIQRLDPNKGVLGIFISGQYGQPVMATNDGEVIYASNTLKDYGNLLLVRHSNGYVTAYAHNSDLVVKQGDLVTKGQTIAHMGNGKNGQPMLEFQVRVQGKPIDPITILGKR